jgi:hypothetical protein
MSELEDFCRKNQDHAVLGGDVRLLSNVRDKLAAVAAEMTYRAESDPLQWASYTYPVLLSFGDAMLAWRLLDMALIAQRVMDQGSKSDYFLGKIIQATYFAQVHLPITMARLDTCVRTGREIVEMPLEAF